VARLIGRLYGSLGVVSRGHLVEATRADLIAGYVGQTALKMKDVVERARGGVLFVDEAYSLSARDAGGFGDEAIATLVKCMEDYRRDLAVIVAGYPNEMRDFIDSNPGLRSRFTQYIEFPNYSTPELVEIFRAIADQAQVRLRPGVDDDLAALFSQARQLGNFGNARFVRTAFESAYANMAHRALEDDQIDNDELHELHREDVPAVDVPRSIDERRIGFRQR
jgi:SpoVK/Ycf46/Vps4 family AAA+-type ATPase